MRRLPDDVLSLLYEKSVLAMADLVEQDPMAAEIEASYRAFLDNVRAYHEISERAYLNARSAVMPATLESATD